MISSQDNVSVGNHAQFCPMFPFREMFALLLICTYVEQRKLEVYIVHIAGMMRWKWNVVGKLLSLQGRRVRIFELSHGKSN